MSNSDGRPLKKISLSHCNEVICQNNDSVSQNTENIMTQYLKIRKNTVKIMTQYSKIMT